MTATKFFTNQNGNTLLAKLQGIFAHLPIQHFDAVVGFFRASGAFRLRELLANVPHVRILVGINVDALLKKAHAQGLQLGNAARAREQALDELVADIQNSEYAREVEDGIRWFIECVASGRLHVKAHPSQTLHSKIYIFRPEPFNSHTTGSVITGSSNLTEAGLSTNFEFNVELRDYADVCFATETFEALWAESTEVLPADLARTVANRTYLNDALTPYEVYLKCLVEYFGESLTEDYGEVADLLPDKFYKLKYQLDAVTDGFRKLQKHHGFFLADVVGLGKTIVGTLIAKRFCQFNRSAAHIPRVLFIAPPALVKNWQDAVKDLHLKNYGDFDIITNGSLHKLRHDPEDYDLIVVDEAHKFRNDEATGYDQLQRICKTPTRRRKAGTGEVERKRVMLISATPLNNRPQDIANLLYLFQDAKQGSSLSGVENLQHFFRQRIDEFDRLKRSKQPTAAIRAGLAQCYGLIREKVMEQVIVRRTRTDLLANEAYRQDLAQQGIRFPEVGKPNPLLYELDPQLDALFDETVEILSKRLTYNRYRAIDALVGDKREKYKYATRISNSLANMMKTLLLKRMDSSFVAFRKSLNAFATATRAMVTMFERGQIIIAPNLPVTDLIAEERFDELELLLNQRLETDPSIEICAPEDFAPDFLAGVEADLALVEPLLTQWANVQADPKLDKFFACLEPEFFNPTPGVNPAQKLVIFSEARDTTAYLVEELSKRSARRVLAVDSSNRAALMPTVRANFDANLDHGAQERDPAKGYDILLTTEVLAEGVNLHRANVIVNYDTPWNSTRLMQRIGRVNRIGSTADRVYVYNFFPTAQMNAKIDLEARAFLKLQAFHEALGEDSEVYSPDEQTGTFGLFDKAPDEGHDERLKVLLEMRALFKRDPSLYARIKALPLRSRVGRRHQTSLAGATVTYLRTARRDAFYAADRAGEPLEELSFLEAVHILRATPDERAQPLPEHHHLHVRRAAGHFKQLVAQAAAAPQVVQRAAPNERRALDFLTACLLLLPPDATPEARLPFRAAQQAVAAGTFQQLQRELNKLQSSTKKAPVSAAHQLAAVRRILSKYPLPDLTSGTSRLAPDLDEPTTPEDQQAREGRAWLPPIIISESLV
jgi:superfamily II DNA/RNA helicase